MFLYDKQSVIKRMKLVIPAMLLCMIGDYSIGIEPTWSKEIGIAASDGWLSISDIRITISNVAGMIGTVLFAIGAVAFMSYLYENNRDNKNRLEQGIEGLGWQLQGNVWELNFALYDQFGRIVAVIGQKMISMHDKYCVDIYQPNAEPVVIAILITLQHMIRDRENSRAAANNSSYSN